MSDTSSLQTGQPGFPEESDLFRHIALDVENEIAPDVDCDSLFHYTSADGLKGIVENNTLHFSDTKFVNDGSERKWGLEVLRSVVDGLSASVDDRSKSFLERLYSAEEGFSEDFRSVIFCLSFEGNLMNQWRDYGKDVVPYCIEFDTSALLKEQGARFKPAILQLEYDLSTQKELLLELCSRVLKVMEPYWEVMDGSTIDRMAIRASFQFGMLLEQFKHPAFAAEKEARLRVSHYTLKQIKLKPKFRSGPLGLVPYYEWSPTSKLAIKSVRVGPSPHAEASVEALKLFLAQNGIEAEATVSEIPIRR